MKDKIKEIEEFVKKYSDVIDNGRDSECYDFYAGKRAIHFRRFGTIRQLLISDRKGILITFEHSNEQFDKKRAREFLEVYHEVF